MLSLQDSQWGIVHIAHKVVCVAQLCFPYARFCRHILRAHHETYVFSSRANKVIGNGIFSSRETTSKMVSHNRAVFKFITFHCFDHKNAPVHLSFLKTDRKKNKKSEHFLWKGASGACDVLRSATTSLDTTKSY